MSRESRPEEFFEALREVRNRPKKPAGTPEDAEKPEGEAPWDDAEAPPPGVWHTFWAGPPVRVPRPGVAVAVAAVGLVVLAAFLIGRQVGWRAGAAAVRQAAAARTEEPAPPTSPAPHAAPATPARPAPPRSGEAELVDGKVFTLLIAGRRPEHLESAKKEVDYLNGYAPFKVLAIQAYVYADRSGNHRVCARGLAALNQASRDEVKAKVRGLKSRRDKADYKDADFYSP